MNEDVLQGKRYELKGGVKEKWGNLTDDDLDVANGKVERLQGLLQTTCGYSKEKAKEEYERFLSVYIK